MNEFWTQQTITMAIGMVVSLVAMIVLPMVSKLVDEQLGYFFLAIGGVMLWLAFRTGSVVFEDGSFVQHLMHGHKEGLHTVLTEPWMLVLCYFALSLLSVLFRRRIEKTIRAWTQRMSPEMMVGLWTLVFGSLGSISVVVMATLGAIFFRTLQQVTRRNYTPSVVAYSATIGISALLTTVGEPLSLFIARNLGQGTPYLVRTFGGVCIINCVFLAYVAWLLARKAQPLAESVEERMVREAHEAEREVEQQGSGGEVREALQAVEAYEEQKHNLTHEVDGLLHSTTKVMFFVWGLLFFGEAVKPVAAHIFGGMHPIVAFFGNSISAVADNALLGLLEVQPGMDQSVVMILGLSLAFWGVGLVPGNICNVVLKEKLGISFGTWAKYGMPLAFVLAALNLVLVLLGAGRWLTF